jgi:hypothetical protein
MELINIYELMININDFEILLIDGMIKLNKLVMYEEIIIFIIAIIILLFYKFNIKLNSSKIMI